MSLCEHAGDDVDIDGDDDDIDGDDDGGHNVSALVIVRARGRVAALALFPPQQLL